MIGFIDPELEAIWCSRCETGEIRGGGANVRQDVTGDDVGALEGEQKGRRERRPDRLVTDKSSKMEGGGNGIWTRPRVHLSQNSYVS